MNKRSLIVVLFALIAVVLGVLFSFGTKPRTETKSPVIHYAAPPPAITNVADAPTGVTVSFVGEKIPLPNDLPVYQFINQAYTNEEAVKIALSLGFTSPPTKLDYGQETRTVWKTNESTLSFTASAANQSWSYVLVQSKTKTVPVQSLSGLAKGFVEKFFFPGKTSSLILQQEMVSPIEHIQIAEIPKPAIRGFLFANRTPNLYTVVSDRFDPNLISVVIDQYGAVRKVSFLSPPVILPGQVVPVISVDDAVASINKGLGLLISVTQNGDSYWEKTPQFKQVSLSDVQLIYYPNKKTSLLTPFFLFRGTATTTGGLVVDVKYAVSATY